MLSILLHPFEGDVFFDVWFIRGLQSRTAVTHAGFHGTEAHVAPGPRDEGEPAARGRRRDGDRHTAGDGPLMLGFGKRVTDGQKHQSTKRKGRKILDM